MPPALVPSFRPWRASDVPALVRHANNAKIAINLKDRFPHPYTQADGERWIALNAGTHPHWHSFAIDVEGEAVGGVLIEVGQDVFRRTADISYWLTEALWGRKVGTAAARHGTKLAFHMFDIERVQALVFEWNPASCRVLEKAGFVREGCLRRAICKGDRIGDVFIYGRLRGDVTER